MKMMTVRTLRAKGSNGTVNFGTVQAIAKKRSLIDNNRNFNLLVGLDLHGKDECIKVMNTAIQVK